MTILYSYSYALWYCSNTHYSDVISDYMKADSREPESSQTPLSLQRALSELPYSQQMAVQSELPDSHERREHKRFFELPDNRLTYLTHLMRQHKLGRLLW